MTIFLFGISMGEVVLLFLVVLMLFGSKKIPDLARSLGKGMNEFRRAADDIKKEFEESTTEIKEELDEIEENIRQNSKEIRDLADDVYRDDYGTHDDSAVKDIYGLDKPEQSYEDEVKDSEESLKNNEITANCNDLEIEDQLEEKNTDSENEEEKPEKE
ncbi:twin-arginine translocase TatA/TatE family subunit [Natronoflexus pectinivorans]|uniref:Sec-independent protein translocase protein TatA n=1 Tax=Natronoflexus pectinivorans TaxID=682526 RepID=A0A4R2GLR4_9BACT|nr:twin-arginine translocase TatA/TatE family subunit [Natronoflexus pectinivorans]TCO09647.1 TatA/E family protein of Tat protein translocase [Natronoflexus pectinivorans]